MAKTKEIIHYHPPQKVTWKIFIGFRKMFPVIPYIYKIPDLKMFKKWN